MKEAHPQEQPCALHSLVKCQSCYDFFGKTIHETDQGWMSHKLTFTEPKVIDPMMRRENVEDLVVIDPKIKRIKKKFSHLQQRR
jgi:hypothetical protein